MDRLGEDMQQWRPEAEIRVWAETDHAYCGEPCRQRGKCDYEADLRWLSAQLLTIQENERKRIATDLHDGLGQSLTLIKLALGDAANSLAEGTGEESSQSLLRLKSRVQDAIDEVRRVAMNLRPSTLDDFGILATLSWFFRKFETDCRDIKVKKALSIQEDCVPGPLKLAIFRILQEAVSNIVKHSKADLIQVTLKLDGDMVYFSIEDNGRGFDQLGTDNYCPLEKGLGLLSMRERAKLSGGVFSIESVAGKGTRIAVSWPRR